MRARSWTAPAWPSKQRATSPIAQLYCRPGSRLAGRSVVVTVETRVVGPVDVSCVPAVRRQAVAVADLLLRCPVRLRYAVLEVFVDVVAARVGGLRSGGRHGRQGQPCNSDSAGENCKNWVTHA